MLCSDMSVAETALQAVVRIDRAATTQRIGCRADLRRDFRGMDAGKAQMGSAFGRDFLGALRFFPTSTDGIFQIAKGAAQMGGCPRQFSLNGRSLRH